MIRVRHALNEQPIDPTKFEQCACALLQSQYPGLSAVEGGHDFGRDADIYFPLGPDMDARGRLLVTTGDPVANLRTGLRRMHEEGLKADLIVMACSRPVNASTRATLERLCLDRGLPAPHLYAQEWFVKQLVNEPAWRNDLLRVAGELDALLDRPLEALDHLADQPPLVGRETTLAMLAEAVEANRDIVLVGVSGVGKTRLTIELESRVVYLEPTRLSQLTDELLQVRPAAVVVDDAHGRLDDMRVLQRARRQAGISFAIIATTWPDQAEEVTEALPGAVRIDVGLLERGDMNRLVTSVGVTGYRARAVVLDQARGRPGWAITLCELLTKGEGNQVVSGAAHLANVERHLRRVTDSETAVDTLACVAALGGASAETLYALAPLVDVPPASMSGLMNRLARNGLVETVRGVWHLQPALCAPLVAKWFFTSPPNRPWSTLCTAFPDHALNLASAMMSAAQVSGSSEARAAADTWAQALPPPAMWDLATFTVVAEYARLDRRAARFAVTRVLNALSTLRESQEVSGDTAGPVGAAAAQLLTQAARQFLLPEAVAGLLDLAVGDHRPRHSTPQHPLRVLSDLASTIDPDFGTTIQIRKLLLRPILDWLRTHREAPHWLVATEALASVFTVEMSGNWLDPGSPDTVTLAQSIDSAEHLVQVIALWDQVASALQDGQVGMNTCPPRALVPLLELAGTWLSLGEGVGPGSGEPTAEQRKLGAEGGSRILTTLHPLLQASPGLALRAQRMLTAIYGGNGHINHELPTFDVDPDMRAFSGKGVWCDIDTSEADAQDRARAVEALAAKIVALGPNDGVARFDALMEQAILADDHVAGVAVADKMAPLLTDPSTWYHAAAATGSHLLLRTALGQWLKTSPDTMSPEALTRALDDPRLRPSVIWTVLERGKADQTAEFVVAAMRNEDAWLLDSLFTQQDPNEVLHRLLVHPVPALAANAAVSFAVGQPHGPALPDQWRPAWREAVQHLRGEELAQHNQWRAGRLLEYLAEHDPDLFEAWCTERLDEMIERGFLVPLSPHGCEVHLARLPQAHRHRLAIRCVGRPRIGPSLLIQLIGPDRDLAEHLLRDGAVAPDDLLDALTEQRNETLELLGPLLLDHGVSPDHIAAEVAFCSSWWGPESARHQHLIDYFTSLETRVPALASVAAAGRAQQESLLREAESKEHAARVRGD